VSHLNDTKHLIWCPLVIASWVASILSFPPENRTHTFMSIPLLFSPPLALAMPRILVVAKKAGVICFSFSIFIHEE